MNTVSRDLSPAPGGVSRGEAEPSAAWRPIATAPKDGTKIDLLYPYPRNRFIDAFWNETLGWTRRNPKWANDPEPLPEDEWFYETLPNMKPLAWMPAPGEAASPIGGQVRELDEQKQSPTEVEGLIERLRTATDGALELQDKHGSVIGYDVHIGNLGDLCDEAADALARATAEREKAHQLADERAERMGHLFHRAQTAEAKLARTRIALEREKLARIIDPVAFEEHFLEDGRADPEVAGLFEEAVEDALTKADAIIALVSPLGGGGGREEVRGASVSQSAPAGADLGAEPSAAVEAMAARAWLGVRWHPDAPSWAHERLWADDWGDGEHIRDFFRKLFTAAHEAAAASPERGLIQTLEEPLP